MSIQITFFDPGAKEPRYPNGSTITVTANTVEEYDDHRANILDPLRGITLIDQKTGEAATQKRILEILPEKPAPAWFSPQITDAQRLAAIESAIMEMAGELYG